MYRVFELDVHTIHDHYHINQHRNMRTFVFVISLMSLASICRAQTFLMEEGDTTVVTEYNDGKQWAYRDANGFVVGMSNSEAKDDYGKYYQICIFISNHGNTPVDFIPEEVEARLVGKSGETMPLKVYTNEKFQRKIKNAQAWAMALYGFSAGLDAGTAGHSTSYSTSFSPNGYAYTTVTHHYDANAAFQANMAASAQIMTLGKMMDDDRAVKEQGYLKRTTVHPGECIVGYMNIKRQKGLAMTVTVPMNGHAYSFDWDVSKKKK